MKKGVLNDISNNMFDEFSILKKFITKHKIDEWNGKKLAADKRWVEILNYFGNKKNIFLVI